MAEKAALQWRDDLPVLIDAYIDWVRVAAKWLLDPKDEAISVPVLVSLQPGKTEREFLELLSAKLGKTKLSKTARDFLSELGDRGKLNSEGLRTDLEYAQFTLVMPHDVFELLQDDPSIAQSIHRIAIAHTLPRHATHKDQRGEVRRPLRATQHSIGTPEQGQEVPVVMGIIDEGIAFANQRFRSGPNESRVEYAWIQDGRFKGDVPYGRELTKADIDNSLRECMSAGQVDEDLFYSATGVVDFGQSAHKATARRVGHGTHVMDLACGYDATSPPARDGKRPIVCVKLPTVTVADTAGLGLEYYVLDGVDYILRKAQDIARQRRCGELPVVINFSSGILAGPRDGSHPIELAIDARIDGRNPPADVVLPSGNSRLSRLHAKIALPPSDGKTGREKKLQFRVLPDDRTCSYLEIWLPALPEPSPDGGWVALTLEPPGGQRSLPLVAGAGKRAIEWAPNDDVVLCKVYYEFIGPPTNRGRYMIALLPSALHESARQLAPFGTWTIGLENLTDKEIGDVEASIQWDDRPLGYPQNGRQSYFIDDRYQRFDEISGRAVEVDNNSPIKRDGSINAIATGSRTIVAGGYLHKENRAVEYSSGGPVSPTSGAAKAINREQSDTLERTGPDVLARSDESSVSQGILAAGTRSGSVVVMNGTSVAAPQIARQLANARERGKAGSGRKIVQGLAKPLVTLYRAAGNNQDHAPPGRTLRERVGSGLVDTLVIERLDPQAAAEGAPALVRRPTK
ncbi:S8 family serine peptidase [Bradyrhizobium sp. Ec3.3]|uniref:S8 family serine peptidase n=1 Tax=Bradyrhizobium sp. Ec3.3 TaxID=189753 RepID=UPI0018DDE93A|nr:S8 family serine peptidase [Bradyrhizobium sp. Ec3.3]